MAFQPSNKTFAQTRIRRPYINITLVANRQQIASTRLSVAQAPYSIFPIFVILRNFRNSDIPQFSDQIIILQTPNFDSAV